jgi:hypothetical protein
MSSSGHLPSQITPEIAPITVPMDSGVEFLTPLEPARWRMHVYDTFPSDKPLIISFNRPNASLTKDDPTIPSCSWAFENNYNNGLEWNIDAFPVDGPPARPLALLYNYSSGEGYLNLSGQEASATAPSRPSMALQLSSTFWNGSGSVPVGVGMYSSARNAGDYELRFEQTSDASIRLAVLRRLGGQTYWALGPVGQEGLTWIGHLRVLRLESKNDQPGNILQARSADGSYFAVDGRDSRLAGTSAVFGVQSPSKVPLKVRGAPGTHAADLVQMNNSNDVVLSRFDRLGRFATRASSPPAVGDLVDGETSLWIDAPTGNLMISSRVGGLLKTGVVTVTTTTTTTTTAPTTTTPSTAVPTTTTPAAKIGLASRPA